MGAQSLSLSTIERLRAWSYDRQRIGDPASTVEQALRAVVAVYATHPTAPLALQVRARSFTAARYRSIDRDRKGIRVPAMRRTIFLVPPEGRGPGLHRDARLVHPCTATPETPRSLDGGLRGTREEDLDRHGGSPIMPSGHRRLEP